MSRAVEALQRRPKVFGKRLRMHCDGVLTLQLPPWLALLVKAHMHHGQQQVHLYPPTVAKTLTSPCWVELCPQLTMLEWL